MLRRLRSGPYRLASPFVGIQLLAYSAMAASAVTGKFSAVVVEEFGAPANMKVKSDLELAALAPAAGQVLVQVHAVGVNPVDTYIRAGTYAAKPTLPFVPGHDCAGVVHAVGEGVATHAVGDRVYVAQTVREASTGLGGAYAEYALAPAQNVFGLPDALSFDQGAALAVPYFTAYRALVHRARVQPDESVLVHGATGAVGTAAIQIARALGCKVVFGTSSNAAGSEYLTSAEVGATRSFQHGRADNAIVDEVMAATDGKGVNVIVENLANVNLDRDFKMVARGGRVAVVGNRGTIEVNPRDLMAREAQCMGVAMRQSTPEQQAETHAFLVEAAGKGFIRPQVLTPSFAGLATAPEAHVEVIEHKRGTRGKVVISVGAGGAAAGGGAAADL